VKTESSESAQCLPSWIYSCHSLPTLSGWTASNTTMYSRWNRVSDLDVTQERWPIFNHGAKKILLHRERNLLSQMLTEVWPGRTSLSGCLCVRLGNFKDGGPGALWVKEVWLRDWEFGSG